MAKRWMRTAVAIALLWCGAQTLLSAQQAPEPSTPSIQETVKYIGDNSVGDASLAGTILTINPRRPHAWAYTVDIMNLTLGVNLCGPGVDAQWVYFCCAPGSACVEGVKYTGSNNETVEDRHKFGSVCFETSNATIAPHVARAMKHLITLVQQQTLRQQPF